MSEPCEAPKEVENAQVKLYHETDPDDIVIAHYTCLSGYKLRGDDEIYCVMETNEWHGKPPTCHQGIRLFCLPIFPALVNFFIF